MTQPTLQNLPLSAIQRTARNPRSDPEADLAGLAASMGTADHPRLAQPPLVEDLGGGQYRILAGERRLRAAELAGWTHAACLVQPALDPLEAHALRLAENLHRRDLHPLDEACALKIAWLAANAQGMGLTGEAAAILGQEQSPPQALAALQALLEANGFTPTRPAVLWDELLSQLGLDISPEQRKKLIRLLGLDNQVQEQARALDLTPAALRSLATLEPADQQRLAAELAADPGLTRKVRRIARTVREGTHTLDQALAEVRGQVFLEDDHHELHQHDISDAPPADDQVGDRVVELLDALSQVSQALNNLGGNSNALPAPWDEYVQDALQSLQSTIDSLSPRR